LKVFLVTADGQSVEHPRHSRTAETALKKAQQRVSRRKKGSKRRRKAVQVLAKRQQHVRWQRHDFHHTTALALVRAYDVLYVEAIQPANVSRRPAPRPDEHGTDAHNGAARKAGLNTSMHDAGWRHVLWILACKAACCLASEWKRCLRRTPRRTVQAVANGSTRACPCARTSVRTAASSSTAI
jgi:putative transposase